MANTRYEALRLENVAKQFEGVTILENVNISLFEGEILGLVGENGAGKTTLIKIICGVHKRDEGQIYVKGKRVIMDSIPAASRQKIACVQQDNEMFPGMTVAENLFIGFQSRYKKIILNKRTLEKITAEILQKHSIDLSPDLRLDSLSLADREVLSVVKIVTSGADVLLMDEPTASLTSVEMKKVHVIVRDLKIMGKSVIYASQNLDELVSLCDRIAVIRDRTVAWVFDRRDFDRDRIIMMMVGKEISKPREKESVYRDAVRLEVKNLCGSRMVHGASFFIRKGEILGLAGIKGSGKSELLRLLFGVERKTSGIVKLNGLPVFIKSPQSAMRYHIAYVPDSRDEEGMFPILTGSDNMRLDNILATLHMGFISKRMQKYAFKALARQFKMDESVENIPMQELSGGTQQKLLLARSMAVNPAVLLLDEPTKGIDPVARTQIHTKMLNLSAKGTAILATFSDVRDMIAICDRILVMSDGTITAEMERKDIREETLIASLS